MRTPTGRAVQSRCSVGVALRGEAVMPRGAAVIRYEGPRGVSWRIEYADADGRQVMETVGRERDGFTRKQAEAELRERLVNVERRGWRKPAPTTFEEYADDWFERGKTNRGWKPATVMATQRGSRTSTRSSGRAPSRQSVRWTSPRTGTSGSAGSTPGQSTSISTCCTT
jgi:hypothetical protein